MVRKMLIKARRKTRTKRILIKNKNKTYLIETAQAKATTAN